MITPPPYKKITVLLLMWPFLPCPGWAMQMACFVFIQRRWVEDKKHMENMLDYFCDIREPLQLLLFPEGTDLTGEKETM